MIQYSKKAEGELSGSPSALLLPCASSFSLTLSVIENVHTLLYNRFQTTVVYFLFYNNKNAGGK